jgi:hypothetical protein
MVLVRAALFRDKEESASGGPGRDAT